ncbi:MAG: hypothetical protein KatS3mg102_1499 [Planctomycetota bacterium]|nr:MAG: hypothetical protein KatS3mg102_1499 [Planctomycetota bacterium]
MAAAAWRGWSPEAVDRAMGRAVLLWLVALLLLLGTLDLGAILGLSAGFGLALALLAGWRYLVPRALRPPAGPGERGPRPALLLVLVLLKLPLAALAALVLLGSGLFAPGWFAAGLALPQLALALMALGRRLERAGGRAAVPAADSGSAVGARAIAWPRGASARPARDRAAEGEARVAATG